jgi:N6-adenosine-specific RNA methylase IME4/ParB-like chromosome segregation protein Spo0J
VLIILPFIPHKSEMVMNDINNIENIGVVLIHISDDRHIPKRPDLVERLASSMSELGLINPICVRRTEENGYALIAGRHRLEAAKQLKWENIQATVLEGIDALDAEQIELCENLIRHELTAAQQSIHYARLKEIAEIKHRLKTGPKDESHDDGVSPQLEGKLSESKHSNSAVAVAKDTNRSSSAVERDAKRVRNIPGIASAIGTSLDSGVELDALASLPEDVQRGLLARALEGEKVSARAELKKQERAEKERVLGQKQIALPDAKFGVILADPPWQFKTFSDKGMDRSADNHYPCQNTADICNLPINTIADRNCILFLWATVPMLEDALNVMQSWGFTYKTQAVWVKDRLGTGYWFRNQHEILLVGVKGVIPSPVPGSQFPSVFSDPVQEHSVKPDSIYRMIEAYFPNLPKIELNARRARSGWKAWGLEAPEQEDEDEMFESFGSDPEEETESDFPF